MAFFVVVVVFVFHLFGLTRLKTFECLISVIPDGHSRNHNTGVLSAAARPKCFKLSMKIICIKVYPIELFLMFPTLAENHRRKDQDCVLGFLVKFRSDSVQNVHGCMNNIVHYTFRDVLPHLLSASCPDNNNNKLCWHFPSSSLHAPS